jgi:serine O-acetyltransferase
MSMTRRELLDADWKRLRAVMGLPPVSRRWHHAFSHRFAPVYLARTAFALRRSGWPRAGRLAALLNFILFGIEIPVSLEIGPGLIIPHPHGTVLGAARIGANVTIFQQVTLGAKVADWNYDPATRPVVEDGVTIAAGAKVLGPVTLGRDCVVGANAVVIDDVAAGETVGGIPARPLSARAIRDS